jgi:hypothetical protein
MGRLGRLNLNGPPEQLESFLATLPLDWLLAGPSFVRYRTLVDLVGAPEDDKGVLAAKTAICSEPAVRALLDRQNPDGCWGTPQDIFKWWPPRDSTFWVLGVLADLGLDKEHERIAQACEFVFRTQLPSGAFGWAPPPTAGDCYTGILAEALAKLGDAHDARLAMAYAWLMNRQRLDGGFWCKNSGLPGRPRELEPSCAFATLCVVGAMAQRRELRCSPMAERGVKFLVGCWDSRGRIKYAGHDSQIGRGWEKLKYPFTDYRILKYLDVLSRFPWVRGDPRIVEMSQLLMVKHDPQGRFYAESIHTSWSGFDFGQKRQPSRWLTLLVYRTVKRLTSC